MGLHPQLFFTIILSLSGQVWAYDITSAQQLFANLTTDYNILLRPESSVKSEIEFSILSVNDLNVKDQVFEAAGWLTVTWNDSRMSWTPASYNGIQYMSLTEAYIWKPELVITNAADEIEVITNKDLNLLITYNGSVEWNPPGLYKVGCDVDITYYPFDTQTCTIIISTWTYDENQLELTSFSTRVNMESYSENAEWTMESAGVGEAGLEDRNSGKSRDSLEFSFTLSRKPGYYVMNIIIPPLLTSFLGLLVFILPAESGEKVGFSITVLLALAVLLTITSSYMPTTSKHTSILGVYLVCVICVSALQVLLTIYVLHLHHKEDKDIPVSDRWQKFANRVLARTSCFRLKCCRENEVESRPKTSAGTRIIPSPSKMEKEQIRLDEVNGRQIKQGFQAEEGTDPMEDMVEYTWSQIATMVDRTSLHLLAIIMVLVTIIFMAILSSGGSV